MQAASCAGGGGGLISKFDRVRDKYFARVCDLAGKVTCNTFSTGSRSLEIRQQTRDLRKAGELGVPVEPVEDCMDAGGGI